MKRLLLPTETLAPEKEFYRATVSPLDSDGDGVEDWTEAIVTGSPLSEPDGMGQDILRANGQSLSGDAVALLERMQGASPAGGTPGSTAAGTPFASRFSRACSEMTVMSAARR